MAKENKHASLRLTPTWLYTDAYRHGPCYVLDPEAWMRGERVVVETIPAKLRPEKKPRSPEPAAVATETRRVVRWPEGRPSEWYLADAPVTRPSEPVWAVRARTLRDAGWSIRRIMAELRVKNRRQMDKILKTTV